MTEIREALSGAFDKVDSSNETSPPPMESGTPVEALADDTPPPGELPAEAAPAVPVPASVQPKDPATGKFLKRAVAPTAPVAKPAPALGPPQGTQQATPAVTPKPTTPTSRAPQSWKPEVREKWATLPPEVQAEVARIDREVRQTMQQAAEARKSWEGFRAAVAPYEADILAEGSDPIKAVGSLLQTAKALRSAPPAHKANLVANIIKQYGVDVAALDAALSGQAPQPSAQPQGPTLDPEALLQQAEQRVFQRIQTQRQQAVAEKARQDAEAFISSGEAEFIDDVRDIMANLLDAAARSGMNLTLQDAYNRACSLHPGVTQAMEQRRQAQAAPAINAAAAKARSAAASVKSQPAAPPATAEPTDIRSLLERNWTRASGR